MSELVSANAIDANGDKLADDVEAMLDLSGSKKKKKSSKKPKTDAEHSQGSTDNPSSSAPQYPVETLPTFTYSQLLERIVGLLMQNNPDLIDKKRNIIKPPNLTRVGTKKTLWVNFPEICKMMRRSTEHVFQYMLAELGTDGSLDASNRFVIKGKFLSKLMEQLLRKYVNEYVVCQMCKSFNTQLNKDSVTRLTFVQCQECNSSRSVGAIKQGFHAQTKDDRRALRNAAT